MTAPRAFVIGWPISHSLSPVIHSHWLADYCLSGRYEKIAVEPAQVRTFLREAADNGFVGGNVTIPHKPIAFEMATSHDPVAQDLQVANTLVFHSGQIHASNTDVYGFLANLDQHAPGWSLHGHRQTAVVIGAGGAARSVCYGLKQRGFTLRVVNRSVQRAEQVNQVLALNATIFPLDHLNAALDGADLIVNTTALGMTGHPPLDIDIGSAEPTALVTDIVYAPLETPLLSAARCSGLHTVDGLGMLLHQAVPGFEAWFGTRPTVTDALRAAVISAMDHNHG